MLKKEVEQRLRGLAKLEGQDPDRVIADFRKGGALANLVASVVGAPARRIGRPPQTAVNWRRFVAVVLARRSGCPDPYSAAAEVLGEGNRKQRRVAGDPHERIKKSYERSRQMGWRDEHVPQGLAALFSDPPPLPNDKI